MDPFRDSETPRQRKLPFCSMHPFPRTSRLVCQSRFCLGRCDLCAEFERKRTEGLAKWCIRVSRVGVIDNTAERRRTFKAVIPSILSSGPNTKVFRMDTSIIATQMTDDISGRRKRPSQPMCDHSIDVFFSATPRELLSRARCYETTIRIFLRSFNEAHDLFDKITAVNSERRPPPISSTVAEVLLEVSDINRFQDSFTMGFDSLC